MTQSIPWNDAATLVRLGDGHLTEGGRTVVAEGPLHRVLALVDSWPAGEVQRHFIALPDRGAAPFRYDAPAIAALLGRADRPGFNWSR